MLAELHLKAPALIYENPKSKTLCSRDEERRISGVLPSATSFSISTKKTGQKLNKPGTTSQNPQKVIIS